MTDSAADVHSSKLSYIIIVELDNGISHQYYRHRVGILSPSLLQGTACSAVLPQLIGISLRLNTSLRIPQIQAMNSKVLLKENETCLITRASARNSGLKISLG